MDRCGVAKFADGVFNGGNVRDVLEGIHQGRSEALQINLRAPLRAVWRWLVLEENLPPHHI